MQAFSGVCRHDLPLTAEQMKPLIAPTAAPNSQSSTFFQPKEISPATIANKK